MWRCAAKPIAITDTMAISDAALSLRPQCLLDRDEIVHGDGGGAHPIAAELDREEKLVPAVEKQEHYGDCDAAAHLRQDDVPQRLHAARAIDGGGFLHLASGLSRRDGSRRRARFDCRPARADNSAEDGSRGARFGALAWRFQWAFLTRPMAIKTQSRTALA
jgi:hypothetical protein